MSGKPTDFVFDSSRIKWNTPADKAAFEASGDDWADLTAEKIISSAFTDYGYIEDQGDLCDAIREAAAAELRKLKVALDDIQSGKVVPLPQNLQHAQAMHLVATAAMKDFA